MPVRNEAEFIAASLTAVLEQDYPRYEIQFVFDNPQDPCLPLAKELNARTLISGPATDTGQKVHNLIFAVDKVDPRCDVIVFVDTDARPDRR